MRLAKFNELSAVGLEAFTRKYDPYWDVPLVDSLPKPVIELPIASSADHAVVEGKVEYEARDMFGEVVTSATKGKKRGRKK